MNQAIRVAVLGFTPFARASFDTFFRLGPRRRPSYVMVDQLRECDVVLANADDAERMAELAQRGKLPRTVTIGSTAPEGVAAHLPRPINMMRVVGALDVLVGRLRATSPAIQRVLDDFATVSRNLDGSVDPRAEAARAATAAAPEDAADHPDTVEMPLAPTRRRALDHILVVDRDDEALRFMALHLERFGFQVGLARSGTEALDRVARRHYEFVFVEAELADVDGYLLCQAIKRQARADEGPPPTVVMMADGCDVLTAARSGLAGSDACLAKPLTEQDLLQVVGGRELHDHAYADTAGRVHTVF